MHRLSKPLLRANVRLSLEGNSGLISDSIHHLLPFTSLPEPRCPPPGLPTAAEIPGRRAFETFDPCAPYFRSLPVLFRRIDKGTLCLRQYSTFNERALLRGSRVYLSTTTFDDLDKNDIEDDDLLPEQKELEPQGVDPRKGWGFRGVHKAIICGKIGQAPVQKLLRNGKTITIFTVGTGGMFDQRIVGDENLPRPAQWHRITIHNETLGAYSVQQLSKNSAVFVEGDIEIRVYNDSITGQIKNVPEICVRRDGKVRLIKSGDFAAEINLNGLRDGLF